MTQTVEGPEQFRMQLGDHLEELRKRLIRVVLVLIVFSMTAFIFHVELKLFAIMPLQESIRIVGPEIAEVMGFQDPSDPRQLRGRNFLEPTVTSFTISITAALIASFPYLIFQLWGFVSPALLKKEKGLAFLFMPSAVIFFYIGAILGFFYVLPWFYAWLIYFGHTDPTAVFILDQKDYFRLLFLLTACFGIILDIPWFVVLLVRLRLVTPERIAKSRRYVILAAVVLAALLSPPDPFSQIALFLPMVILFEIGLLVSRLVHRRAQERLEEVV